MLNYRLKEYIVDASVKDGLVTDIFRVYDLNWNNLSNLPETELDAIQDELNGENGERV